MESDEARVCNIKSYRVKQLSQTAAEDDDLEDSEWDAGVGHDNCRVYVRGIIKK